MAKKSILKHIPLEEQIAILQQNYSELIDENDAVKAENERLKKVIDRPGFVEACLRNEWYILGGIRNHLRHIRDSIADSQKSVDEIRALPEGDEWKKRAMRMVEINERMISELRQHEREYQKAADELQAVMKVSMW